MAQRPRLIALLAAFVVFGAACATQGDSSVSSERSVRLLLVGDAMLGRGVAPIVGDDPDGLFRDIRRVIRDADVAAVNIESPLTERPHSSSNPYALEASPASAGLLAAAGFDVASIANNHGGDAGAESVEDSIDAIAASDMVSVGGGQNLAAATELAVVTSGGLDIGFLAFDVSGQGLAATPTRPGIAHWDEERARRSVRDARQAVDVLVVSIHGGVEYRQRPDPLLTPVTDLLARWGVDVVWGHGPHVEQPITVSDPDGDGRPTLIATSLGNFIFDQQTEDTSNAPILEVLVTDSGVVAHRVGDKHHDDLRVHFAGWRVPDGDAALLFGSWWQLDQDVDAHRPAPAEYSFNAGVVIDASSNDLDADGTIETLLSYRHLARDRPAEPFDPLPTDALGRSAHIGVLAEDSTPIWLSRRPPRPVGAVAACDGTAAFAYVELDTDDVTATGAGTWSGFGFVLEPELPGTGRIGCADVDGDGRLDAVSVDRNAPTP